MTNYDKENFEILLKSFKLSKEGQAYLKFDRKTYSKSMRLSQEPLDQY